MSNYDRTKNKFILGDCMHPEYGLPSYPDKFFDLAIVDPPYGIGASKGYGQSNNKKIHFQGKTWDNKIPDKQYFNELFRVSKNQIIWGGNYFYLAPSQGFVIWDKMQQAKNLSDCEMAWTSFQRPAKIARKRYLENYECNIYNTVKRIHPTQKPVDLYRWLLKNYAQPGDLILDTHVGSASSLIACESMDFNYHAFEIDPDYYAAAKKRMSAGIQKVMF